MITGNKTFMNLDITSLLPFFYPKSVAVIGASTQPNKIGGRPIAFLKKGGYQGAIYPINPSASEIQGLRAYPSLLQVSEPVDQAIIALPASYVAEALEACIEKGVKCVQIFSAGYAEASPEGRLLQNRLAERAAAADVRLLGPNTLGLFNVAEGFFGTFAIGLDSAWPTAGGIGIASQSGAFGSYLFALAEARRMGFSHFVTTGNEADIDVAECIAFLAQDDSTQVIIATFEGCQNGQRLIQALEFARAQRKPVLIMKVGSSQAGAAAAATHTGSLAGADAVFAAVFHQYGAYRASSMDELLDLAYVCSQGALPRDASLGILTTSGGIGVLMADTAAESGLELPQLSQASLARIQQAWPYAAGNNPLDTTAQLIVDLPKFADMLELMLEDGNRAALIGFLAHVGRNPQHFNQLRAPLLAVRRRHPEQLFVLSMLCEPGLQAELEAEGFLVFADPSRSVKALAAAARLSHNLEARGEAPPRLVISQEDRLGDVSSELLASRLLQQAGIPMALAYAAATPEEAGTAALKVGLPVAMKVLSPDIAHKSDIGGVALNLKTPQEIACSFDELTDRACRAYPRARLQGVLVQPMIQGGVECILGVQRDPVFGPVVMFGLGGIFVEVLRDVALRVAPVSEAEALQMIEQVKGARILYGLRGQPGVDLLALSQAIANLSRLAYEQQNFIESIDINPLIALPSGVMGVDALIQVKA